MSQWYNADFEDLDWVQAPPKALNGDKKNGRKDSYNNFGAQGNFTKKNTYKGDDNFQAKPGYQAYAHQKKQQDFDYTRQNTDNQKTKYGQYEKASKKPAKQNPQAYQKPQKYSRYDDRSTDVSDENSPDRFAKNNTCTDIKVEVFGEVVIDCINPKFNQQKR
jgi:hypothetical protein